MTHGAGQVVRCCWARRRCAGSDQSDKLQSRRAGRLMAKVNNEHNFPAAHEHILSCVALQFCWGLGVDESCICKFPRLLVGLGAKEAAALDPYGVNVAHRLRQIRTVGPGRLQLSWLPCTVDARSQHPQSMRVLLSSQVWPRKLVFSANNAIQIIEKGHKPSHHSITVCTHPSRARTSASTLHRDRNTISSPLTPPPLPRPSPPLGPPPRAPPAFARTP